MIFITGYRTSDCANAVDIAAARYKLQANVECNDLPGVKCWNGGRVISTSHFLQIKIPGWAGPRSPWHREYPRHREQLILSQARCGDVTCSCHVSRVTQWLAVVPAWHWSLHHTSRYYVCVMNTIVRAMMDEGQQQDHRRPTFTFHEKQK